MHDTTGHIAEFVSHYREHRDTFVGWAAKEYGVEAEEAKDAFQEAVCALYEQQLAGGLVDFSGNMRTYLFAIGRNHLLNRFRQKRIQGNHSDRYAIHVQAVHTNGTAQDAMESEEEKKSVHDALSNIDATDRKILKMFYIEELKMEEIAEILGYKNANVIKKKKHYAMKKLIAEMEKLMGMILL